MAENQPAQDVRTSDGIFREKSLMRVSSPEALNDYIRVTTPSVWLVLGALVVLLVWSIFGTVETHAADGSPEKIHPITYVMN